MTASQAARQSGPSGPRGGFTLIELMVVAGIIAMLLTLTVPAAIGMMRSSQIAQADNLVRASLLGQRAYAMKHGVVAGIRCQSDGHVVPVYARNMDQTLTLENLRVVPTYEMASVGGSPPEMLPGPYRVTSFCVANMTYEYADGWMWQNFKSSFSGAEASWAKHPVTGKAGQWLNGERWFLFPVTLFRPDGRVMMGRCIFPSSPAWYPTLDGAFGCAMDKEYRNFDTLAGWRSYNPTRWETDALTGPMMTSGLRIFNWDEARTYVLDPMPVLELENDPGDPEWKALFDAIETSASDNVLDLNTGMVVRRPSFQTTQQN